MPIHMTFLMEVFSCLCDVFVFVFLYFLNYALRKVYSFRIQGVIERIKLDQVSRRIMTSVFTRMGNLPF